MPVVGLGYVGLDAHDLDAWRRFATEVLAMQVLLDLQRRRFH